MIQKIKNLQKLNSNIYTSMGKTLGMTDVIGGPVTPIGCGQCYLCGDQRSFSSLDDADNWMENHLEVCVSRSSD